MNVFRIVDEVKQYRLIIFIDQVKICFMKERYRRKRVGICRFSILNSVGWTRIIWDYKRIGILVFAKKIWSVMNKFNHIFSRYIKKIDIFHKITLRAPKKHTIFWQPANWLFVLIFERVYFYLKQNFTKCQYSLFNRPFRKLTQSVCLLQKKMCPFLLLSMLSI